MIRAWVAAGFTALIIFFGDCPAKAQNAYITNAGSNTVSVIDIPSNTVIGSPIRVGNDPVAAAVTPDGSKVYVTNYADNTVSVIDTASNTVIGAPITVGHNPIGVAVTPDGTKVYVTNINDSSVSVISTASNTVIGAITIGDGEGPYGVVVTPDGSKVYFTNYNFDNETVAHGVSVIDTASNTVTVIDTPNSTNLPVGVAVTPDGGKVYYANSGGSTVSVIDTASNIVIADINVGTSDGSFQGAVFPSGVAVTPDGSKVYVTNSGTGTVSVIDTASNTVIGSPIPVGNNPLGVAVTPDGSKVYIANNESNTMSVIDTATNTVIGSPIPVGNDPITFGAFIVPAPQVPHVPSPLVSAVLPGSRSVVVGGQPTVYATVLNSGTIDRTGCQIGLTSAAPAGLTLSYQTTDPVSNALTGTSNTPTAIPAGQAQTFLLTFASSTAFSASEMPLGFICAGAAPASPTPGVNTIDLLFSPTPVPDIIAIAATTQPGIVSVPFSTGGTGAFAVATDNLGVAAQIRAQADYNGANLPLITSICQTNTSTGACLLPPAGSAVANIAANTTTSFAVFVQAKGAIPFAPAAARIFVRFVDIEGVEHGSTSVAVETN